MRGVCISSVSIADAVDVQTTKTQSETMASAPEGLGIE